MPRKNIIFTKHALERMEQREILREQVTAAIKAPTKQSPIIDLEQSFSKEFGTRILEVITRVDRHDHLIVTTWWSDENDKRT